MLIIIIFISIAAILGITAISYHNHLKTKAKDPRETNCFPRILRLL